MKMFCNKWLKRRKRSFTILSVLTVLGLLITLSSIVIPKIMAGDTVVSDLVLQANTEDKLIALTVTDSNQEDTKIVVPLPEGVTYQSNSNSSIGVTQDTVNNQLVIDWVEGQEKQVTLQLEAKEEGSYDFTARTVREGEPVSSVIYSVTIESQEEVPQEMVEGEEELTNPPIAEEIEPSSDIETSPTDSGLKDDNKKEAASNEIMEQSSEKKLPADAHIDNTWVPLTDSKLSSKIKIIDSDKKPAVASKYSFYPAYFENSIYKKNGQVLSPTRVTPMDKSGDQVTASILGRYLGEEVSGKITKKNNNLTSLGANVSFPGVTKVGKSGKGTINDFTTYGDLNYSFSKTLSGQLTLTDFDANEAIGIPLSQVTELYATKQTTLYGKVSGNILYVAGGTNNPDWTSPNGLITILFDNLNSFDLKATNENSGSAVNMRPASEGLLDVKKSLGVDYLDEAGQRIAPLKLIEGAEGTAYDEKPIDISGYKYKSLSANSAPASGKFSDSLKNIEFVYEKLIPVDNVTVKYVNTFGDKVSEDVILSGNIGEEFKTEQKDIPGYTFKKVEGPTTGKFTDQPQTITYTYTSDVLRFYDVPSELSFNETKISSHTETISRQDPKWKIIVEDTRLSKRNWRVTAQLVDQFKDSSGQPLKNDVLLFRKGHQSDQWISSSSEVNVFDGTSTETDDLYDVLWPTQEGPLLQVAPGTVKVGKYTGVINWKLIDAPV